MNAPALQFVNKAGRDGTAERQPNCTIRRQEVFSGSENT